MVYQRCDRATHIATVGLIFDIESLDHILLLRKQRPEWCAGQLLAPGGLLERGEGPLDCVHREIREETGLQPGNLTLVARLHRTTPTHPYLVLYFYRATLPFPVLWGASNGKENAARREPLSLIRLDDLGRDDVHPNTRFVAQMARNAILNCDPASFFDIYEEYKPAHERFGGGY